MKKRFKILLGILAAFILLVSAVFITRKVNSYRYQDYITSDRESIYVNPTDLSLYDTEIEGVMVEEIEEGLVNGFHLVPEETNTEGVIVTFGGSEGSINYELAREVVDNGHEVYSLFFFGIGDLPDELIEVPLDLFENFLTYHSKNGQLNGPITVLGASKGAELTLNLAARYDEIDHIVLFAPSSHSFFSLDDANSNNSSWTYDGQTVPYLSNRNGELSEVIKMFAGSMLYYPIEYKPVYQTIIEGTSASELEAAIIKVENFMGDGLLFVGGDDLMLPAETMAREIKSYADDLEIHTYPQAGHSFGSGRYMGTPDTLIAFGGEEGVNQEAYEESIEVLLDQLMEWHSQ